ncbi:MAG: death on curing protein [Mycobacteriales bacterium]
MRDAGLLDSAAARPRATVFGADAYPDFADKAAALMHSLAGNHALVGGNKPLAWAATRTFCLLNGRDLVSILDDAEAMVLAVAAGQLDVPRSRRPPRPAHRPGHRMNVSRTACIDLLDGQHPARARGRGGPRRDRLVDEPVPARLSW